MNDHNCSSERDKWHLDKLIKYYPGLTGSPDKRQPDRISRNESQTIFFKILSFFLYFPARACVYMGLCLLLFQLIFSMFFLQLFYFFLTNFYRDYLIFFCLFCFHLNLAYVEFSFPIVCIFCCCFL